MTQLESLSLVVLVRLRNCRKKILENSSTRPFTSHSLSIQPEDLCGNPLSLS
jgi:hypothetical protein